MDDRVLRFRVGVVVLTGAGIAFLLVLLFSAQTQLFQDTYSVVVRFPDAPGVSINTPVRKSGIQIGRVSNIELLERGDGVRLTLKINREVNLQRRELPRIVKSSLVTNDAALDFTWRSDGDVSLVHDFDDNDDGVLSADEKAIANQELADGDYMANGYVVRDPMQALSDAEQRIGGAFMAVQDASLRFSQLVDNLNAMLSNNDAQFRRIMTSSETMIGNIDQAARDVSNIFGDDESKQKLREAIDKMPAAMDDIRLAAKDARETMNGFKEAGKRADRVLANVEQITAPLAERSERLAENLVGITNKLDSFLLELNAVGEMLARGDGTVAKLLREDDIYEKLSDTVDRFDALTLKLEPLLNDARIAMDKVARDPSVLIRGAISGKPAGAGLKTGMDFGDTRGRFFPNFTREDEPSLPPIYID